MYIYNIIQYRLFTAIVSALHIQAFSCDPLTYYIYYIVYYVIYNIIYYIPIFAEQLPFFLVYALSLKRVVKGSMFTCLYFLYILPIYYCL